MNKTKTYYQPVLCFDDGTSIDYGNIPAELKSFQAFATEDDCEEWLVWNSYDPSEFTYIKYEDDDIEGVTIIDEFGDIVEVNEDEDETENRYFSEDLCAVLEGKMPTNKFRRLWGEISYDAMNCIINVGNNTIITNEN